MKSAEPVQVVQSPTMRSLRPRTVKQELDLAKKKKFVRTKLPRAEKTIERLEEEEAERAPEESCPFYTDQTEVARVLRLAWLRLVVTKRV